MTNEDQDAIIGKAVRLLRDVKEQLAQLKSKAHAMADGFGTVSYHLKNKPELLRLERESTDTRFVDRTEDWKAGRVGNEPHIPSKDELDINKVPAIRDEIRDRITEKERLERSLKDMGYSTREAE
jgi:hypothetical protein